jgi:hypothetical protein
MPFSIEVSAGNRWFRRSMLPSSQLPEISSSNPEFASGGAAVLAPLTHALQLL